jgi:hypothetical protein
MQMHLFPSVLLAGAASKKPCSVGLARGVRPVAPAAPWLLRRSLADGAPRPGLVDLVWCGRSSATFSLGAARTKLGVRAFAQDRHGWCEIEGVETGMVHRRRRVPSSIQWRITQLPATPR